MHQHKGQGTLTPAINSCFRVPDVRSVDLPPTVEFALFIQLQFAHMIEILHLICIEVASYVGLLVRKAKFKMIRLIGN